MKIDTFSHYSSQLAFFPKHHTTEILVDTLEVTVSKWNLSSDNLVCLTTDSGSNIIAATKRLHWTRLSWFGHNLDLSIAKAKCDWALALAQEVVSAFFGAGRDGEGLRKLKSA